MRQGRSNLRLVLALTSVVVGMVGLSFAAVPLYRLFCQVTGYGGTTQVAQAAPEVISDSRVTVRFNADKDPALEWRFEPLQKSMTARLGEQKLAFFRATNLADHPVIGTATFNVTPLKAGLYFNKLECFCFTEQRLEPGQSMDMPVAFFVDPAILEDEGAREVRTVTLSYTFFPLPDAEPEKADRDHEQVSYADISTQGER
jgi:cytochrome c oxidase assembly protein subunit 11